MCICIKHSKYLPIKFKVLLYICNSAVVYDQAIEISKILAIMILIKIAQNNMRLVQRVLTIWTFVILFFLSLTYDWITVSFDT